MRTRTEFRTLLDVEVLDLPGLQLVTEGIRSRSRSRSENIRHRLGVTSSTVWAPTSWCHSVATFFCTRVLLSMMVPVIDQPASFRAMRPA